MSLRQDGKKIACDGPGCTATAAIPVALRSRLLSGQSAGQAVEGWLFVLSQGGGRHFCPYCAHQHLIALSGMSLTEWPSGEGRPANKLEEIASTLRPGAQGQD